MTKNYSVITELNDINGADVTPTLNPTSKLQAIMVSTSTDFSAAQAASLMVRIEGQGVKTPIAQIVTSFGGTSTSVPSASSVADIIPLNLDVVHNSPIQVFASVSEDTGKNFKKIEIP